MNGKAFIDGEWVDGDGEEREKLDPGNLETLGTFRMCSKDQIGAAVDGAMRGFEQMRRLGAKDRARILAKAAENVGRRFDEISNLLAREGGKVLADARYETQRCVQTLSIASEEARRLNGEVLPMDAWETPDLSNRFGFTRLEPVGVVAAIAPFNFPLMMPAHKLAPALAAGNSVVLKPSTDVPFTSGKLVECLLDAGLPGTAVSLVYAEGETASGALVGNPKVRMVAFTGSTATGRRIAEVAGRDAKRVLLEMGGKNPMLVFDDADVDDAVGGALRGGFTHAGQVCIATGRILVHRKVHDSFVEKLAMHARERHVGHQLAPGTQMGPLINEPSLEAVGALVEEARQSGLGVLCGGKRLDLKGYYYAPTVISGADRNDRIAREEIFGPVLPVMSFDSLDGALEVANSLPYGLSSAVYTRSMETAFRCIERLETGGVSVNDTTMMRADQAPFGGFKASGLGREGIRYAIREMSETKMVYWKKY